MTHTYQITGMTCNGCRASVLKYLQGVEGVSKVSVDLEKGEAAISMEHHIPTTSFKEVLPSKYTLSEKNTTRLFENAGDLNDAAENKSKLQQLQPLFLIFGYLAVAVVLLNYKNWQSSNAMLDFMGLFYIVFSFFKLLDLQGFPASFRMYDPLAKAVPFYAWLYPFIETALGLMLLLRFEVKIALLVTILILGITTVGVTQSLFTKKKITCACLGTALKLPMTEATFIENTLMIAMAIIMLLTSF